ncbi:hypothetical protein AVEN_112786-1 [Araneus ventricosus]|uniref:Retroviral polymerase SH3-like domain-containing protein n=1 Tax=Araneus ventricosus TaxID=182803 RepID=A0A4Y2JCY7_ARAVE|nr:hypothetical protein AVEN_112786-1 [Araneus ventricosus]
MLCYLGYPMKTKDDVLQKFDEYRRMAENLHNRKIKILRSDNGGEYRSSVFNKYLAKLGTQRVFGCGTWSHVHSHSIQNKLHSKAKECVLVGYPEGVKGYKLWDLKKKSFFTSRDVIFEENIFPFKEERHQNQSEEKTAVLHIEDKEMEIRITSPPEPEVNTGSIQSTNNTTEVQNLMSE